MSDPGATHSDDGRDPAPRRRRVRYAGTHPRRFEERYKERDPNRYPEMQEHVRNQGRTPAGTHVPVLLAETLAALAPQPGEIAADCTLGYGGHALALLQAVGPTGRVIALDHDDAALERARSRLSALGARDTQLPQSETSQGSAALSGFGPLPLGQFTAVRSNFAGLAKVLAMRGVVGVDMLLADLGVSSMQIDDPARGFSYKHDGPLDMRMDARIRRTAADWLATADEGTLASALRDLADEPDAERIAREIISANGTLRSTHDLVELLMRAKGAGARSEDGEAHPAARTFQALRMLVNDELSSMRHLLRTAPDCLNPGGRIVIISFHSGEDRLVKRALESGRDAGIYAEICEAPIRASALEQRDNPRSRPAKLRWARRGKKENA